MIGEAAFAPALFGKKQRSTPVIGLRFIRCVRVAVDFDDQVHLHAREVCDERTDGVLASEAQPIDRATAKVGPEHRFGLRHGFAKVAAKADRAEFVHEWSEAARRVARQSKHCRELCRGGGLATNGDNLVVSPEQSSGEYVRRAAAAREGGGSDFVVG